MKVISNQIKRLSQFFM